MKRVYDDDYRRFLAKVWKRDKGRCQYPGCKKRGKNVHHILRWADTIHFRIDDRNGILLCEDCHKSVKGKESLWAPLFNKIVQDKYDKNHPRHP